MLLPGLPRQSNVKAQSGGIAGEWEIGRQTEGQQDAKKGEAMIYKLNGRKYYRVKFQFKGETIHKCTRATDAKSARSIEAKIRTELAQGQLGHFGNETCSDSQGISEQGFFAVHSHPLRWQAENPPCITNTVRSV